MANIFKKLFNKASKFKSKASSDIVLYNDAVTLVHDATKICWYKPQATTYKAKTDYIAKRIKIGHESVLEHSNIVASIRLPKNRIEEYIEVSGYPCRYLNIRPQFYENGDLHLVIGGSIRGYKHLIKECISVSSKFIQDIIHLMYAYTCDCFFGDLIDDNIMDERLFNDIMMDIPRNIEDDDIYDLDPETENANFLHPAVSVNDEFIEIVNIDSIHDLYDFINNSIKNDDMIYTIDSLLDMCTVTIKFKKMSRIITQQLTRHRNGITQASGRYIDLSGVVFNSPDKFKNKYNSDTKYEIKLENHNNTYTDTYTLQELGDMLCGIYSQLRTHGLDKEDARGYLPQNTECGDIYMTFTYRTLFKFLQLRLDLAAQPEIRNYATIIYDSIYDLDDFKEIFVGKTDEEKIEFMNKFLLPQYKRFDDLNTSYYDDIDEIITIEDEET